MHKQCSYEYYYSHLVMLSIYITSVMGIEVRMSRDSSVRIATGYGLYDRMIGVRFPAGVGNFALRDHVQTGSGAKWPGCEANHSPPCNAEVKECVGLYLHSPNTSSWRGA
jgi:hypothetical protein